MKFKLVLEDCRQLRGFPVAKLGQFAPGCGKPQMRTSFGSQSAETPEAVAQLLGKAFKRICIESKCRKEEVALRVQS